jgi:DNA (cytosine-5)-methyltransferase 3A
MKNILSLFDGMSCCQLALNRAGIQYENFFASEVDKYAMQVTMANYPETKQIGDVRRVNVKDLPPINLLAGGSPCQCFSFAGKRKGMVTKDSIEITKLEQYLELKDQGFEFEGQSYLFWEYVRILKDIQAYNPDVKFLLENVMMAEKWRKIITQTLNIRPIMINAALVSAQNRERLFWTNINAEPDGLFGELYCKIPQPKDREILLKDILETDVDEKYYLSERALEYVSRTEMNQRFVQNDTDEKGGCVTANYHKGVPYNVLNCTKKDTYIQWDKNGLGHNSQDQRAFYEDGKCGNLGSEGSHSQPKVLNNSRIRRLTPIECERLQCVPDLYTAHVSDSQRYKMLGNGWNVDVITHIFGFLNSPN